MKTLAFTVLIIATSIMNISAQNSCCLSDDSQAKFAMLGENESFRVEHEIPEPFVLEDPKGNMIQFPTGGNLKGNAYFIAADKKSDKYLFVLHEWWGLNDHIKKEADRYHELFKGGVNVIALDIYDGKVADNREDAAKYMKGAGIDRNREIINGAIAYAGKDAKIATIGWCFGGGLSLETAILASSQSIGCVIYYGQPSMDVSRLRTLNCDVLGIFASLDGWIDHEMVENFRVAMEEAEKGFSFEFFEADHAFANPSSERYDENAAQMANRMAESYLKKAFGLN
ncbi:MAG: dienelactone hydrolase family protein [Chitinophagales bacterium]|nr:dienelactone hydrolase family protein [Chitinophagales bacterium]